MHIYKFENVGILLVRPNPVNYLDMQSAAHFPRGVSEHNPAQILFDEIVWKNGVSQK